MDSRVNICGKCPNEFDKIKRAFEENFVSGRDVGASVAVSVDGEVVVDLWGGYTDAEHTRSWQENTIVNVYSTTKVMAALVVLVLIDRGQIGLDEPVATYWPDFSQNGKEHVLVRHLLNHSSGLSGFEVQLEERDFYNWSKVTSLLAEQKPWWAPGTSGGYHVITHGYLLGEVVRRVTGVSLGQFFLDEIAGPLEADFHIGLGASEHYRVADLIAPGNTPDPAQYAALDEIARKSLQTAQVDVSWSKSAEWKSAEIPASNGHGNARSIVKVQSAVANGGSAFGVQLLSPDTVNSIFDRPVVGTDLVLGVPIRYGLGYGLQNDVLPLGPNKNVCYWGGYGGSLCLVDLDANVCFAFAMNKMFDEGLGDVDIRSGSLLTALYDSM